MIRCLQCHAVLSPGEKEGPLASISGGIAGDEYTEAYFLCAKCGVYTVEVVHEPFLGQDVILFRGPVPRAEGDAAVALIGQCLRPWDKTCRCTVHLAYFKGALD